MPLSTESLCMRIGCKPAIKDNVVSRNGVTRILLIFCQNFAKLHLITLTFTQNAQSYKTKRKISSEFSKEEQTLTSF